MANNSLTEIFFFLIAMERNASRTKWLGTDELS